MAGAIKLYWDSCAWLGLANDEPGRVIALEDIYEKARAGKFEIWTSTISIVEANRLQGEENKPKPIAPAGISVFDKIFQQPFIKLAAVDFEIAVLARRLIRETPKFGNRHDAIHLASAVRYNIPIFHTYDNAHLLPLDGKIKCDDGTPMTICEPRDPEPGLFDPYTKGND